MDFLVSHALKWKLGSWTSENLGIHQALIWYRVIINLVIMRFHCIISAWPSWAKGYCQCNLSVFLPVCPVTLTLVLYRPQYFMYLIHTFLLGTVIGHTMITLLVIYKIITFLDICLGLYNFTNYVSLYLEHKMLISNVVDLLIYANLSLGCRQEIYPKRSLIFFCLM